MIEISCTSTRTMMMDRGGQQQALSPPMHNQVRSPPHTLGNHHQIVQQQQHQAMAAQGRNNENCQQVIHHRNNQQQIHYSMQQHSPQSTTTTTTPTNQMTHHNHNHQHNNQQNTHHHHHQPQYDTANTQQYHQNQHSYRPQQQQQQQQQQSQRIYLANSFMAPGSVNGPPTPPSEEQQPAVYLSSQVAPAVQQQVNSRAQTGEWVMQTVQIQQQQQPQMVKQQQADYQGQSNISSYYYDIDDGFSDIMSAPASPEPCQAPEVYATADHYAQDYLAYEGAHEQQQQPMRANNVQAIDSQQQFLSHEQSYHYHRQQQQQQHQHHNHHQHHNQYQPVAYAAAMSPDSCSLSTTSSSPSDHSLYQASPPMVPHRHQLTTTTTTTTRHLYQHPPQGQQLPLTPPGHLDSTPVAVRVPAAPSANQQVVLKPIMQQQRQLSAQAAGAQPPVPNQAPHPHPHHHHRSSPIHLWEFLKELLGQVESGCADAAIIRWLDRQKGVFKIEDSVRVAKLWGKRKNKPKMNYDKLSRSIRQYYKKGIMKKTDRSQRLVYQFCSAYCH